MKLISKLLMLFIVTTFGIFSMDERKEEKKGSSEEQPTTVKRDRKEVKVRPGYGPYDASKHRKAHEAKEYALPEGFEFEEHEYKKSTSDTTSKESGTISYAYNNHYGNMYPHLTVVEISRPIINIHVTFGNNSKTSPSLVYTENTEGQKGKYEEGHGLSEENVHKGKLMVEAFLKELKK